MADTRRPAKARFGTRRPRWPTTSGKAMAASVATGSSIRPTRAVGGFVGEFEIARRRPWLGRLVVDPFEEVARLAAERATHRVERAEPDGLGPPVLEDSDVGRGEPDLVGELADAHLPLGQLDLDVHHDRHQMTSSSSVCSSLASASREMAWASSVRRTNTRRPIPPAATEPPPIRSTTPGATASPGASTKPRVTASRAAAMAAPMMV